MDDNITLDVERFEELCTAIIRARLNRIDYLVQAMTASIAAHGERLAPLMKAAGFRYVFLGIENVLDLLQHYPRRWIDRTKRADIAALAVGEEATVFAEVRTILLAEDNASNRYLATYLLEGK